MILRQSNTRHDIVERTGDVGCCTTGIKFGVALVYPSLSSLALKATREKDNRLWYRVTEQTRLSLPSLWVSNTRRVGSWNEPAPLLSTYPYERDCVYFPLVFLSSIALEHHYCAVQGKEYKFINCFGSSASNFAKWVQNNYHLWARKAFSLIYAKNLTEGGVSVCAYKSRRLAGEARRAALPSSPAHPVGIHKSDKFNNLRVNFDWFSVRDFVSFCCA